MNETALMEVGSMPTLDHVTVTMSARIGELLRTQDPMPSILIDQNELLSTLEGLGEFDSPNSGVPLNIHFPPVRWRGREGGFAIPVVKDGELVERAVIVPLFRVSYSDEALERGKFPRRHTDDDYVYDYDSEKCNEVLLHELKHAVDYLNPELRQKQKAYERADKRRIRRVYGALMAATIFETGVVEAAFSSPEARIGGAAVGLALLNTLVRNRRKDLQTKQFYNFNSYLNSPLERRAYRVSDRARKQGKIPRIIQLGDTVS